MLTKILVDFKKMSDNVDLLWSLGTGSTGICFNAACLMNAYLTNIFVVGSECIINMKEILS